MSKSYQLHLPPSPTPPAPARHKRSGVDRPPPKLLPSAVMSLQPVAPVDALELQAWKARQVRHPYLGPQIRYLRTLRRMTREELAAKLGVGYQTIRNWESRRTEPSVSDLVWVAAALEVEDLRQLLAPSRAGSV